MKKISQKVAIFCMCLLAVFSVVSAAVYAESETVAISKEQIGAITQSCDSIKQSLKTLQKDDARTRAYLGTAYENLLTDFISPLNLRLVKNDKPSATLTDIHSTVLTKRQDFSQSFIVYSQDLEKLISIDCKTRAEEFYAQLVKTRTSRSKLEKATTAVKEALTKYQDGVKKLKGEL